MRFVFCTLLFICSASLASLTREIGPQVIKGDPAAGKRSPPRSVVAPRLHMTDSALKFTHILYNLSPAGTVVPFSSFLFCVEQVHFLGSRCSLIFVVSSQHQFQLPPWSRYCWVMWTFQCLLSLKCFRITHITPPHITLERSLSWFVQRKNCSSCDVSKPTIFGFERLGSSVETC